MINRERSSRTFIVKQQILKIEMAKHLVSFFSSSSLSFSFFPPPIPPPPSQPTVVISLFVSLSVLWCLCGEHIWWSKDSSVILVLCLHLYRAYELHLC